MKLKRSTLFLPLILSALASANAAPITRTNTTDNLNLTAAWTGGVLPTTADVATWDAASTLTNTMGAANTWGGLNTSAASGAVSIAGANNLVLGNSTAANTVFNTGANGFTWGAAATAGAFNINGAAGTSSVAAGATFSGSGTVTLSSTGTKNWSNNATTNGVTNVNFTGTLALRGAVIPAVGSLSGNWIALGGGGGAASDVGTTAQTGSFALDTGDSSTCGSFILTHGWSGQFLKLNSLQGTGSIRCDWGLSAGTQTRGIELNQAGNTTLSGSIIANNGSGQRRNVSLVKKGAGALTLTGGLGASGTASLNFDIQAGAIQLGDGTTNPIYVNAASWDAASTFNIASGAKLRFMANESLYTWSRAITAGSGKIEITNDGTLGEGNVAFTANSSAFAGDVDLLAGSLRIGPNLGTGTLTAKTGTFMSSGLPATNGTSQVGALVLEPTTESDYRLATTNDKINVLGSLTPPASGFHTLNLLGTTTAGGTITLIDYTGTPLNTTQFERFKLGTRPPGIADYQLVNNTANTSIDLLITLENQVWKGSTNGEWDSSTTNWALESTPSTPTPFNFDHPSLFNDTAAIYTVNVESFGVFPSNVTFANNLNDYTFTGGEITGPTALTKNGNAQVTLAQPNTYSGPTTVNAGKLNIGAGGTTGGIGTGAVVVGTGAALEFNRSNTTPGTPDLDYKTNAKMRNVSGAGNISLTGGAILFNYTGTTLGFADANSWAGFSGNLTIKGGSEFQTIRNGATAMGTGNVILGDGGSSGSLSQIEGSWTWTNPIQLVGAANKMINRSAPIAGGRALKLQGVISGSGGLSFEDAAAAMTEPNRGYILTAANTMNGALTIATGVAVRVGGVPGNTDVTQGAAAAFGTLGGAVVTNNGTLTFSRTDAHSVANAISGTGAVRIGIPAVAALGDTTTQVLTYTGTASHSGPTTVNNGTLIVGGGASMGGSSVIVEAPGILGGNGTVPVPVTAAGTLAPGTAGVGTLTVGNTTLTGTYACDISGANADRLVAGTLNITGATLTLNGTPSAASYLIATYTGALSGTFAGTLPAGYSVNYATPGQIQLVNTGTDFDTWMANYPSITNAADKLPTADPDKDGLTNQQEYAFGLDPSSGGSVNPITSPLNKTTGTLTYTRRKPSLTGLTYKVWTSTTLAAGSWTVDATATQTPTDLGDNQSVVVTLTGAPLTAAKLFVRITAE